MTRQRRRPRRPEDCFNLRGSIEHPAGVTGQGRPVCARHPEVILQRAERREEAVEGRSRVIQVERPHNACDHLRPPHLLGGEISAVDEPRDQDAPGRQAIHHLWTDAGPARGDEALILALAINAQAFGALPFDPDHERLSVHFHPVVHVGNAAANRRGCQGRRLSPYGDAGHSLLDRDGQGIRYGPMTGWRRPAVAWGSPSWGR